MSIGQILLTLLLLFGEFFKIGLFTFGGGYAMIPLIKETVMAHNWMSEETLLNLIGVCESTPGAFAINCATYVGATVLPTGWNILGAIVATLGVTLPSYLIIIVISLILAKFLNNKYVKYIMMGINAVVIALILSTGISFAYNVIGFESFGEAFNLSVDAVIIIPILLIIYVIMRIVRKKDVNTILFIGISAVVGLLVCVGVEHVTTFLFV